MPSTKASTAAFVAKQVKKFALTRASQKHQTIPVEVYARTKAKLAPKGQAHEHAQKAIAEVLHPDPIEVERAYPTKKSARLAPPSYLNFPSTPSPIHHATLIRSSIATSQTTKDILTLLGLTKLNNSVLLKNSPLINGALTHVKEHVRLLPLRIVAADPDQVKESFAMESVPGFLAPNGTYYLFDKNPPFYLKPFITDLSGKSVYPDAVADYNSKVSKAQQDQTSVVPPPVTPRMLSKKRVLRKSTASTSSSSSPSTSESSTTESVAKQ